MGRVNDKLQTNDDCDIGKKGLVRAESSDEESSNADSSLVPNIDGNSVSPFFARTRLVIREDYGLCHQLLSA